MFCTEVGTSIFVSVICWSPAAQAGAFPWAFEVSNSYFYHKREILLQGTFHFGKGRLLAIRVSVGEYQRWEDYRQKPWVVLPYLLQCLLLTPPVICTNSPPQPNQHPHSFIKSSSCSKNKILIPQEQPAFSSLNPHPIIYSRIIFRAGCSGIFSFSAGFLLPRRANKKCHTLGPRARTNSSCWHPLPPATAHCESWSWIHRLHL